MKIVQAVGWYYPDSLGGTEVYVQRLSAAFQAAGHDVLVAAPDPGASATREYEHEGVRVFRFPVPVSPTRDEAQHRTAVRGASRFHGWLARERPDVVHLHTFVTGLGVHEVRAARAAAHRVIATTHSSSLGFICQRGTMMRWGQELCDGVLEESKCAACELQHRGMPRAGATLIGSIPSSLARWGGILPGRVGTGLGMRSLIAHNRAAQREIFQLIDRFVVLTNWAIETLLANGAPRDKVALIRLGVDTVDDAAVRRRASVPPIRVGYLGRFDPIKGVYDLADAIGRLPADLPIRFELRGPVLRDRDRAVRDDLVRLLGRDSRVSFPDGVTPSAVNDVLRSYDVLCCPARSVEGGPTAGLEALAVGTPVIAATPSGVAELIDDGSSGRLVPLGDASALAAAFRDVALNPSATVDRWRANLPRPRTMQRVADDYLALYCAN